MKVNADLSAFLNSLAQPLGKYLSVFRNLGITEVDQLKALALMPRQWQEAEKALKSEGVTVFEWWVLRDALEKFTIE